MGNPRRHETLVDAVIARLSDPTHGIGTFGGRRGEGAGVNVVRGGRVVVMSGVTSRDREGREVADELIARGCMVWYLGNNIEASRDEVRWDEPGPRGLRAKDAWEVEQRAYGRAVDRGDYAEDGEEMIG